MSEQKALLWTCILLALLVCANLWDESHGARRPAGHATGPFGIRKSGRIINGTEVNPPYKYPYMGMLWWNGCESPDSCSYYQYAGPGCGATIIDKYWLVTAGHCCVYGNQTRYGLSVILGVHNWSNIEPWTQNLTIAECIAHELYV